MTSMISLPRMKNLPDPLGEVFIAGSIKKDLLCCFYIAFYLCFQCVYGIKLHFAADIFHPFQGKAFPIDFFIKINDEGFDCFSLLPKVGFVPMFVTDG